MLGADLPHGEPLIAGLEEKDYIVIASVSTPEAADALESRSNGYLKALVLDPNTPGTVPVFLRSLSSCLSRRFPLSSPGDPFASPNALPYIHSVINLLPLTPPSSLAPLENISLQETFVPYMSASHLVPLEIIQALLPLFRAGLGRHTLGKKSIVFCVPATSARVGLPFAAVQSMATASTLRAAEILRREISLAALTDKADVMKNIRVVVVDVGAFDVDTVTSPSRPEDVYRAMESWTQSEKVTYGPSFASVSFQNAPRPSSTLGGSTSHGLLRKPTDISVFVHSLLGVVANDLGGPKLFGLDLEIGTLRSWIRGDRFATGAGGWSFLFSLRHFPWSHRSFQRSRINGHPTYRHSSSTPY